MGRTDELYKQKGQSIVGIKAVEIVSLKDRKWQLERGLPETEVGGIRFG